MPVFSLSYVDFTCNLLTGAIPIPKLPLIVGLPLKLSAAPALILFQPPQPPPSI